MNVAVTMEGVNTPVSTWKGPINVSVYLATDSPLMEKVAQVKETMCDD